MNGFVAAGFEDVRDAFAANFSEREELGAAFAATLDGEPVVDLWGGIADRVTGRPWGRDTLQVIFSGAKGMVAVCLLMLIDCGRLELDAPVSRYWPEFAAEGKEQVLVSEVASHRCRLPGVRTHLAPADILDGRRMAELLAAQPQETDPRAADAYHALTFGWLCGELVRRVDGRSIGRFFAEEVASPLGLEAYIGLPEELESRVSRLEYSTHWDQSLWAPEVLGADELLNRIWNNPPVFPPGSLPWNERPWHAAEIPAAGAVATPRSMARLYGCLARGGELDGVRLVSPDTLSIGRRELSRRHEPLLDEPQAFGVGFHLQTEERQFGPPEDAFGHPGAGGSVHGAWPSARVGFSYAMNGMRGDELVDPRSMALMVALDEALASSLRDVDMTTLEGH